MEIYKEAVARCLTAPLGKSIDEVVAMLRLPPEPDMGDYAFPCFTAGLRKVDTKPPLPISLTHNHWNDGLRDNNLFSVWRVFLRWISGLSTERR